jgi:uncharacterized membrane protein YccC
MTAPRFLLRLPPYLLNGIGVALGVALLQISIGLLAGHSAALAASSAAVCTSLADVPNAPHRTWKRVVLAALLTGLVGLLVGATRGHPVLLGLTTALIAFCSAMALVWGPRAGAVSFVGILAYVFALATPPVTEVRQLFAHAAWSALGALFYLGWAMLMSLLLQRAYRRLSLAATLQATAQLLRGRAAQLAEAPHEPATSNVAPLQQRIADDAVLDERLQSARDFLFAAPPHDALAQRNTALLLLAIDLRDALMTSELDLDLLGVDAFALRVRDSLSDSLREMAAALDDMARSIVDVRPLAPTSPSGSAMQALAECASLLRDAGDARAGLLPAVMNRARHMLDDIDRMQQCLRGDIALVPPLSREELQLFVSVEGWPLAALRPHANLRSPITRHALRAGVALTLAYFIGRALPWASHPHWLVLSVAVVLRGNLEQTLSRRNGRVAGTVLGCLLVLLLGNFAPPWLAALIFLTSVGVAHSYVNRRYLVTATAASVMALLQAHLAQPDTGFAVPERLADTVLGALLAWAFSYVLPSWERRALPRIVGRLLRALGALSRSTLRWPQGSPAEIDLRLARREVYDALGGVATAAQRTRVEPEAVRVPLYALSSLLANSHALLAHLAAVKLMLTRRSGELDRTEAERALHAAAAEVGRQLASVRGDALATPPEPDALPTGSSQQAPMPWLQRRLQRACASAARVAHAARVLQATVAKG